MDAETDSTHNLPRNSAKGLIYCFSLILDIWSRPQSNSIESRPRLYFFFFSAGILSQAAWITFLYTLGYTRNTCMLYIDIYF